MSTTITARIAPVPKGAWSNSTAYSMLDIVTNGGSSYIAKQNVPAGTALSNTTYWQFIAEAGVSITDVSVEKTSTSGAVDTYTMTITYSSGSPDVVTFDVTNGSVTSVNGRTGAVTGLQEDIGLSIVDGKLNITYEV